MKRISRSTPTRGVTKPGTNRGSFAPHRAAESGADLLPPLPTPSAREWSWAFPNPVGTDPFNLDDLNYAAQDPEWVALYNATPLPERRPLQLFHSTPDPDPAFSGLVHFGTEDSAISRAYDTVEPGNEDGMWLLEAEWKGDLSNPTTDTAANMAAHPNDFANASGAVYSILARECETYGIDPDMAVADAAEWLDENPDGALLYFNDIEMNAEECMAISLVARTPTEGWHVVSRRLLDDDDFERVG